MEDDFNTYGLHHLGKILSGYELSEEVITIVTSQTKIYDQLLEFYKFRDLIFEYGQDGFSCIVHSINVDGALDLAEQVYVAISKILEENGMNNEIGIGISTRSFRLIPGKRILLEAEQALQHAFEDPETAIVAFRVDPEKYRKYISEYADEEDQK